MTKALGENDLIASHYTVAGAGYMDTPRTSFQERVVAAQRAGFAGIGLFVDDYVATVAAGTSPSELRSFADDHGIAVAEIEFLMGWSGGDDPTARATEQRLHEMADTFGARHMNVAVSELPGSLPPVSEVAERFGAMCDRAAEHDLLVAIEFMPFLAVSDVTRTMEIIDAAGRPNGGMVLDAYHFFRGNPDLDALRRVPPDRIVCIQLCDAAANPSTEMLEETTHHRLLPGQGSFDLVGMLDTLTEMGVRAPRSVEILSDALWSLPVDEAAQSVADATRAVIGKVGAPSD